LKVLGIDDDSLPELDGRFVDAVALSIDGSEEFPHRINISQLRNTQTAND
jgi:hypothetical protein